MSLRCQLADGKTAPNSLIFAVSMANMEIGMPRITEKNFNAFRYRIYMYERCVSPIIQTVDENGYAADRFLTLSELMIFIGATFNVAPVKKTNFERKMSAAYLRNRRDDFLKSTGVDEESLKD